TRRPARRSSRARHRRGGPARRARRHRARGLVDGAASRRVGDGGRMTDRVPRWRLLLRHYLASPWRSPLVAIVVALAAFGVAAAPAAASTAASAELRAAVDDLSPATRDLVADSPGGV